jgi:hypothetical protein
MAARRLRIAIGVVAIIVIAAGATVVIVLSQYVTIESANEAAAARAFAAAREHLSAQTPLIVYGTAPVIHRDTSSPRRTLGVINVLAYDADDEELKRVSVPSSLVELLTLGGRIRLMNLGAFGDERDRITLEDLERHGPGLVLDTNGTAVPQLAVADLVLGGKASRSHLMIWTD